MNTDSREAVRRGRTRPTPDPETRSPASLAGDNRAGSRKQREALIQYLNPEAAAKAFGARGHQLSLYDGRRLTGFIVDCDEGRRLSAAHAFDVDGRPLGIFPNRRTAMGAIVARDAFELRRAA